MEIYHIRSANPRSGMPWLAIRTKWCNKFGSMKKDLMAGID